MGFSIGLLLPVKIPKELEVLKEFRKYELQLYKYFFDPSKKISENLEFYFIPKEYIIRFCEDYKYSNISNDLDNLIVYSEAEQTTENKIILKNIIENLEKRMNMEKKYEKINNSEMTLKIGTNSLFFIHLEPKGSFIPLTKEFWNYYTLHCEYDMAITKKGFVNNGEIFILTEEEKRIDCFFTLLETKDIIYHYCLIMSNIPHYNDVVQFFKMNGHKYTAKYIISISGIEIGNVKQFKAFQKKIPKHVSIIENYHIAFYFIDSFKFNDSNERNSEYFKNKETKIYQIYLEQSRKINKSINQFKNNNN